MKTKADQPDAAAERNAELTAEFRNRCYALADAIIRVVQHSRCPAYMYNSLGDAVTEMSNHQMESQEDEQHFIRAVCSRAAI